MKMEMAYWSELPKSLFESILEKLSTMDIIRVKMVCTSWFSMVDAYISSPISASMRRSLVLMTSHQLEGDKSGKYFSFLSVADNKVYKLQNMSEELRDGLCVGSSHGWLLFLDKNLDLCLYNPFSKARKQVSSLRNFPYVQNIKFRPPSGYGIYIIDEDRHCVVQSTAQTAKEMPEFFIHKAILFSKTNPSLGDNKFGLLVIHVVGQSAFRSQLAFYDSEVGQWTKLGERGGGYDEGYFDIIHHNRQFYALRKDLLEIWDYDGHFPMKIKEVNLSLDERYRSIQQSQNFWNNVQYYIVESEGKILHVTRIIAILINIDDLVRGPNGKFQLYKTVSFLVHMMDLEQEKLIQVESLDGRAIFLGRNHSQSFSSHEISELEENSIYFTDYLWRGRGFDGHDMGIYDLKSKTVKPYLHDKIIDCGTPPFWLFANLC
ncbi:hypothetical protein L6164_013034 [Bauhinia variegata]|uniref:Uncharacterized protein n=1 Tax=Bauhinia variegata TaxID=167791 RepID=A0ACB9PHB4_BAUVA|nr:hypothetical protein L6164_013034 [Bauhinia variegata]